jgi:hypothetical protein
MTQASSTSSTYFFTDNPSQAQDWSSFAAMFDSYRVCAVKIRFIPDGTFQSITQANPPTANPLY